MILSVPLFYAYPSVEMGILMAIQTFEIVRFCITWPFVSKCRNLVRLALEITLLLFFTTGLIQCLNLSVMRSNNSSTLESSVDLFNMAGWIGVATIIIFNVGCMLVILVNLIQHCCCSSNKERIR